MGRSKIKFNDQAFPEILKSTEMQGLVADEVDNVMAGLDPADYGDIVEDGGDRVRGAVWTVTAKAMRDTARHSDLLNALGGGA